MTLQLLASIDFAAAGWRLLHIAAAVLAAGGAFFQFMALHPALQTLDAAPRRTLREAVVARWRGVVFASILALLVSGLVNFVMYKVPEFRGHPAKGLYHGLFGLKFLLALVAFHSATVLVLPGKKGEAYRDNAGKWLTILVSALAAVIVVGTLLRNIT
jgi:uncharacterized membrane protein